MSETLPLTLILYFAGTFFVGWVLSALSSRLRTRQRADAREDRDNRLRTLEAEHRIAKTGMQKSRDEREQLEHALAKATEGNQKRDKVIEKQQERIEALSDALESSRSKARELRSELSQMTKENLKSEMKIREVETELEVVQASTDLIATGVLDYSSEEQEADDGGAASARPDLSKSAG